MEEERVGANMCYRTPRLHYSLPPRQPFICMLRIITCFVGPGAPGGLLPTQWLALPKSITAWTTGTHTYTHTYEHTHIHIHIYTLAVIETHTIMDAH